MKNVLGIDIGGTKIAVCLANEKGEILGSERFPSTKTCEEAVDRIASLANDLLEMKEMTMADVACCGISAPPPGRRYTPPGSREARNCTCGH